MLLCMRASVTSAAMAVVDLKSQHLLSVLSGRCTAQELSLQVSSHYRSLPVYLYLQDCLLLIFSFILFQVAFSSTTTHGDHCPRRPLSASKVRGCPHLSVSIEERKKRAHPLTLRFLANLPGQDLQTPGVRTCQAMPQAEGPKGTDQDPHPITATHAIAAHAIAAFVIADHTIGSVVGYHHIIIGVTIPAQQQMLAGCAALQPCQINWPATHASMKLQRKRNQTSERLLSSSGSQYRNP